jgi:hypothetical protein
MLFLDAKWIASSKGVKASIGETFLLPGAYEDPTTYIGEFRHPSNILLRSVPPCFAWLAVLCGAVRGAAESRSYTRYRFVFGFGVGWGYPAVFRLPTGGYRALFEGWANKSFHGTRMVLVADSTDGVVFTPRNLSFPAPPKWPPSFSYNCSRCTV